MNTDYVKYLILLVLIVFAAVVITALFMFRLRRNGRRTSSQSDSGKDGERQHQGNDRTRAGSMSRVAATGNISVFFDNQENVTIIPYVPDLFGSGKATADVSVLRQPYKAEQLGAAIRSSLATCCNNKPTGSIQLMEKLHSRDWKSFTEGKLNLSIYCKDTGGIVFNTTVRTADGAYVFMKKGAEFYLPVNADDVTIGEKTLELIKRCRC